MTGFNSPNHTQTPNDLFDLMMPLMGESELKVVLFAVRKTLGFHKGSDAISLSQFVQGTGLSRQGVLDGLAAAVERGVLEVIGQGKRGVNIYGLVSIDDQSTELTSTSQQNRPVKPSTSQQSRHTKEKDSKETTKESTSLSKAPKRTTKKPVDPPTPVYKKEYEDVPKDTRRWLINAWCSNLLAQPIGAFKADKNHETAADLHRAGITEDNVADFVREKQADPYWKDKTLTLQKVAELIPAWLQYRKAAPSKVVGTIAPRFEDTPPADPTEWAQ